jgi:hypothetical protein
MNFDLKKILDLKKISRQKLVMAGGLSIVGAAVVIRMVASGPESAPAATVAAPPGSGMPLFTPAQQSSKGPIAWPKDIARDPFQSERVFPPGTTAIVPKLDPVVPALPQVDLAALVREKIDLKGTILGERPIAMMNGRVYRVGEVVEGFKIVEIEKNQITVERDGKSLVVAVQ